MPYLLQHRGPQPGQRFSLVLNRTVIGRDPAADLAIPDDGNWQAVSWRQAVITRVAGAYFIEDGDGQGKPSTNHTGVNGTVIPFPGPTPCTTGTRSSAPV